MSASRVGGADGMDVDEAEVALPTNEWMEAAQRAADTDGILENGPAKRQKVCNPCCTLTALNLQTSWPHVRLQLRSRMVNAQVEPDRFSATGELLNPAPVIEYDVDDMQD